MNLIIQPYNLSIPCPESHQMITFISSFADLDESSSKNTNKRMNIYFGNSGPENTQWYPIKSVEFTKLYHHIKSVEVPDKYLARLDRHSYKHAMLCVQRYLYELQRLVICEDVKRIVIFDTWIVYLIWILTRYLKYNPYSQLNSRIQMVCIPEMINMLEHKLPSIICDITHVNTYPIHLLISDSVLYRKLLSSGIHSYQLVKIPDDILIINQGQSDNTDDNNEGDNKIHVILPIEALAKHGSIQDRIEIRVPAYYPVSHVGDNIPETNTVTNNMYTTLEQIVDALIQKCKLSNIRLARHLPHAGVYVTYDIACYYVSEKVTNDQQNKSVITDFFLMKDWNAEFDCRLLSMSLLPYLGPVDIHVNCAVLWSYKSVGINLLYDNVSILVFDKQEIESSQVEQVKIKLPISRVATVLMKPDNNIILDDEPDREDPIELQNELYDFQPANQESNEPNEDIWILDDIQPNSINIIQKTPGLQDYPIDKTQHELHVNPDTNTYNLITESDTEPIIELKEPELPKFAPVASKTIILEQDDMLDAAQYLARCGANSRYILSISRTLINNNTVHGSNSFRYEPQIMEQVNAKYYSILIPRTYDSPYKLYQQIGIESGLIMSKAQITRWYPDIQFENTSNGQIICGYIQDSEFQPIQDFVQNNIYNKTAKYFLYKSNIVVNNCVSDSIERYRLGILIQIGTGPMSITIAYELLEMVLAMVGKFSIVIAINITNNLENHALHVNNLLNKLKSVKLPHILYTYVITTTPDLGTDISPFFMQYFKLTSARDTGGLGLEIDYILKLHTKTNADWRLMMCRPFTGGYDMIAVLIARLDSDKTIGMLGAKACIGPNNHFCDDKLETYFPGCTYIKYQAMYKYVAGTIFLTRSHIISDTINMDLKFTKALLCMPYYYDNSLFPHNSPAHTFERILGYMACKKYKKGVVGV